jgi:hypothetical protein
MLNGERTASEALHDLQALRFQPPDEVGVSSKHGCMIMGIDRGVHLCS